MYKSYLKRAIDILLSSLLIIIFLPLLFISVIAIIISSSGSPLFKQRRVGRNGRIFTIYKLRTMTINTKRSIKQTKIDDPELFLVGRLMRRLKIDELPQLVNVFLGEMSLIGPRPCLEITFDEMPNWAKERVNIRPGLTGLAQINGNIDLTWEERWYWDIKYVHSLSFCLDFYIIARTALVVLLGEGRLRRIL